MYEGVVQDLIDELGRLPGVGPKSAQRIAFHILSTEATDVHRLAGALLEVKDKVRFCVTCGNVAQEEQCKICRDPRRDLAVLCVVEESKDVVAIERTREFRGRYHVLGGAISPIEGIGPDELRIRELMLRLADDRHLPDAPAQTSRVARHSTCQRAASRGRFRVRRRGDPRASLRGETLR